MRTWLTRDDVVSAEMATVAVSLTFMKPYNVTLALAGETSIACLNDSSLRHSVF